MVTVDTTEMKKLADEMSTSLLEVQSKIENEISTAISEASQAEFKASKYNGQELSDVTTTEEGMSPMGSSWIVKTQYYNASVTGQDAFGGLIRRLDTEKGNLKTSLSKIQNLVDTDIPAVIECIEKNKEEVETALAQLAVDLGLDTTFDGSKSNDTTSSTDTNTSSNTSSNESNNTTTNTATNTTTNTATTPTGGSETPGGGGGSNPSPGGGGGGGGSNPSPTQQRQNNPTQNNATGPNTTNPNVPTTNNSTTQPVFSNDTIQTKYAPPTKPNETTGPNSAETPTIGEQTKYAPPIKPQDNPTPSETVISTPGASAIGLNPSPNTDDQTSQVVEVITPTDTPIEEVIDDSLQSIIGNTRSITPENSIKQISNKGKFGTTAVAGVAGLAVAAGGIIGGKALIDKDLEEAIEGPEEETFGYETNHISHESSKDDKKNSYLYGIGLGIGVGGAIMEKNRKEKIDEDDE